MGSRSTSRLARSARGMRELAQSGGAIRLTDYQRALVQNAARFILLVQARQTGKSFGCSLKIDLDVVETELKGRSTAWAVLSRTQRQSRQVMAALRQHLDAFDVVFNEAEIDWGSDSDGRRQTSTEIRFPGGSKITALPASPGGIRGLSGHVYFDEADIVPDFRELWAGCSGIVTRGFRVLMSTTPMQTGGWVHQEMTAAESVWDRHTLTIHQAVEQGMVGHDGQPIDVELLRRAIGDEDTWQREFLCRWPDQSAAWLPIDLILACESDGACPAEHGGGVTFIGVDVGIRRDLWVAVVVERVGDVCWVREISTMRGGTFEAREVELARLVGLYRPARVLIDQTGIGEQPVERARKAHGARVEGVTFGLRSKFDLAQTLRSAFESRRVRIPDGDNALREDLSSVRREMSLSGAPRFVAERNASGHADRFWGLALALTAASTTRVDLGVLELSGETRASSLVDLGVPSGRLSLEGF